VGFGSVEAWPVGVGIFDGTAADVGTGRTSR
jgi:hypothetical protein